MTVPLLAPQRAAVDPRLDLIEEVIRWRSITTSGPQRIVSPDGRDQAWLLDLRPVLLDGRALSTIAALFWERFRHLMPFQVCGLESASIPLLSAIAIEANRHGHAVSAFIVRKERKTSGLARDIEGNVTDAPVVVVDDLTNSAASLEKVRVVLADRGLKIARAFVVVDFQAAASLAWRASHGIEIESLFDGKRFGWPATTGVQSTPLHRFQPIWSTAAPGANHFIVAPRSSPACDGRSLYVGTEGGELRAVDAATGGEIWSFRVPATAHKGIWSSPAISDGRIIFGAYDGAVYCLASATGEAIWRAQQADWVGSSPVVAHRHGLVIIGLEHATPAAPGSIVALDLASGAKVWEHPVAHFVHGTPTLAPDEARLFIGTNGGEFLCLETATGALVWRYQADGPIKAAAAVSPTGVVVVGSFDGGIHLVDAATGKAIAVVKTAGAVYSTPMILDGRAFVGSQDKHLHVVALAEGRVVKSVDLGARIFASPALLDGLVFVGTTAGRLFGIDPGSLATRESLQVPDRIVNAPLLVADGNVMVVPVMGNRLFGFRVERLQDAAAAFASLQPDAVASERAPPLSAAIIDSARAEELYFRIDEPTGVAVSRPFSAIPSRRLLGAAMLLLLHAAGYRELGLSEVKDRVLPALLAGQARVFLYGMQPIGLVTWANLSADAEARLVDDGTLPGATGWSCGDRTWIIDIVAPFGGSQAMLDKVRREALRGRAVHRLHPRPGGGYERVSLPP